MLQVLLDLEQVDLLNLVSKHLDGLGVAFAGYQEGAKHEVDLDGVFDVVSLLSETEGNVHQVSQISNSWYLAHIESVNLDTLQHVLE